MVKVTLKPLAGASFIVECEGGEPVASLKTKIAATNPAFPIDGLVLIYKGAILSDDSTLDSSAYGKGLGQPWAQALFVLLPWQQQAPPCRSLLRRLQHRYNAAIRGSGTRPRCSSMLC